jgi:hypothetical protein
MGISADTFISVWRGTAWKLKLWGRGIRQLLSTSNGPLNITESLILRVTRAAVAAGGFTPMVAEDSSGFPVGQAHSIFQRSNYSTVTAKSGTQSVQIRTDPGQAPNICGGSVWFAKRRPLPALVPVGKTAWQRIYFYLPTAFSMGYVYGGSGDAAEASACGGKPTDGGVTNLKWMSFTPDGNTSRIYFQPYIQRRQALQAVNPGCRVITEFGSQFIQNASAAALPRDRWFSIELAVKVSKTTADGFIRAWVDGILQAEMININTIAATDNGLAEWGIGDYWNGIPWTDGAVGRDTFYVDEIIVASDMDGYGAPTATDAVGNLMIGKDMLVSGLGA